MCALLRYLLGQREGFFESCGSASSSSLPPFPFQGFLEKYPFKLDRSLSLFLPFCIVSAPLPSRISRRTRCVSFSIILVVSPPFAYLSSPFSLPPACALHHRKLRFCGGTNATVTAFMAARLKSWKWLHRDAHVHLRSLPRATSHHQPGMRQLTRPTPSLSPRLPIFTRDEHSRFTRAARYLLLLASLLCLRKRT